MTDYRREEIADEIKVLPPVLLLSTATIIDDRTAVGTVRFDGKEEFWRAHLVGKPILPGMYQLEAIAQLSALLLKKSYGQKGTPMIVGVSESRFYLPVAKEDICRLEAELVERKRNAVKVLGKMKKECRGGYGCDCL